MEIGCLFKGTYLNRQRSWGCRGRSLEVSWRLLDTSSRDLDHSISYTRDMALGYLALWLSLKGRVDFLCVVWGPEERCRAEPLDFYAQPRSVPVGGIPPRCSTTSVFL